MTSEKQTVFDFKLKDYRGNEFSLDVFKGKVMIIVNVASKCGLSETSYRKMKEILDVHKNKVVLVLCPCKQFLNQEHDDIADIAKFVQSKLEGHYSKETPLAGEEQDDNIKIGSDTINSDINVVLTEALHVKGSNIDPLFAFMINEKGGWLTNSIKWNFSSFIIDKKGLVIKRYSPMGFPIAEDTTLVAAINETL